MRSPYTDLTVHRSRLVLSTIAAVLLCCFARVGIAQPIAEKKDGLRRNSVSTAVKSAPKHVQSKATETSKPLSKEAIVRTWRCISKQPMLEVDAKEVFSKDQKGKGEGRLTFSWTDGTKLDLFFESTSRWRIDGGQLCDVPTSMHFTQMSGELNPHVDQLMAAMQAQADKRMASNLETCKRIKSLTDSELILSLPSPQGEVETRCTPAREAKDEK